MKSKLSRLSLLRIAALHVALGGTAWAGAADASTADEANPEGAKVDDPCYIAMPGIVLKSTRRQGHDFSGVFEIWPSSMVDGADQFVIQGQRHRKSFHVEEPDASFEFKDLTGQWNNPVPMIADRFTPPPHQLAVSRDGHAEFVVQLPPSDMAAMAREWRLVLRSADNKQCSVSLPFKVRQQRGPVTGFVSAPRPSWMTTSRKRTPCPCRDAHRDASASMAPPKN